MAKLVLNDIVNTYNLALINSNFTKIENEFQNKVLYRDNPTGEPNQMQSNLDMNSNRILNLPAPTSPGEPARIQDVLDNVITYPSIYDEGVLKTTSAKTINFVGTNVTAGASGFDATVTVTSDLPTLAGAGGAALIGNTPAGNISATTVQAAINELDNEKISLSTLAASTGSSLVGFLQAGTGATSRTVQSKLRETVSITDFGAVGGGVDDTAAIQAAINYAIANNKALYVPSGSWRVSGLTYSSASSHSMIYGDGSGNTIIYNDINTNPVITFTGGVNQLIVEGIRFKGNGSITSWGSGNGVAGNSLVGTIPTTLAAVTMIDMVHATFFDCYFTDSIWGADVQGGIAVSFLSCYAYWNAQVGYRIYKSVGSGWPNVISLLDSSAVENGQVGVYYDDGRQLIIRGGHYEGNGKNTVQAPAVACGVFIGSNTGIENGATSGPNSTPFHTIAAVIDGVWFEQNGNNNGSGVPNSISMAHIIHQHGSLSVDNCILTNTVAGRGIRVNGGRYKIENCSFESTLNVSTNYVDEGATTGVASLVSGNYITNCTLGANGGRLTATNCTIDTSKTYFDYSRYTPTKILTGSGTTSSGTLVISWPAGTWLTTPIVQAQVFTNDAGTTTYSAEVFATSTTGATIRAKQNSAGTVTQPALLVTWIAVGT